MPVQRLVQSRTRRRFAAFLLVAIGFSLSIVYTNVQFYDPAQARNSGYTDTIDYIRLYNGESASGIRSYRLLVPLLARAVPDVPNAVFSERRQLLDDPTREEARQIALKFGVVNLFFLIGTCIAFYALLSDFGCEYWQAFLGVMLFLSSQTIVRSAGLPMVDTAFFCFFTLCLLAVERKNVPLLLAAAAVGVVAKELIILVVPAIVASGYSRRIQTRLIAAVIPAMVIYGVIRLVSPVDTYSASDVLEIEAQMRALLSVNGLFKLMMSFGLVWIPAAAGLRSSQTPQLVRRWVWLVVVIFLGVVLAGGNIDRGTFSAFPIIIPLAIFGLTDWIQRGTGSDHTFDLEHESP